MMVMRSQVPKIPGLDTTVYANWHWSDGNKRKAFHIECAQSEVKQLQTLFEIAKKMKIVETFWGPEVKLSNVITKKKKSRRRGKNQEQDTGHAELDAHRSYAIRHIDYQASMTYRGINGIFDIDKLVNVFSVSEPSKIVGKINLRGVLYSLKTMDDLPLFAEVHQASAMKSVDVVIGNSKEGVAMVEMMNKNIAAYLYYFLPTTGMEVEFIMRLVKCTIDPSLAKEINKCTWDEKNWTLTTPMDEENAKRKKLEDAAWYQSDYGAQLTKGKKGAKDDFLAPEDIYKLDDDHTYKTLNERPGTYKGSPGAETLDLGKVKEKPKEVDLTREEDEMSVMTNATNFSQQSREE